MHMAYSLWHNIEYKSINIASHPNPHLSVPRVPGGSRPRHFEWACTADASRGIGSRFENLLSVQMMIPNYLQIFLAGAAQTPAQQTHTHTCVYIYIHIRCACVRTHNTRISAHGYCHNMSFDPIYHQRFRGPRVYSHPLRRNAWSGLRNHGPLPRRRGQVVNGWGIHPT